MSRLRRLRDDFARGRISKEAYVREMHETHALLYEYAELLPDTDVARITIADGEVVMTLRSSGAQFICDPRDHRIAPIEILNFGQHEPAEAALVRRLVRPGQRVFDIGANIGFYAVGLALAVPDVEVHAFEPIPQTFEYLKRNVDLNNVSARVNLHPFGLSDAPGSFPMYFYPEGSGNASLRNVSGRDDVQEVRCQLDVLDDFVEREQLAPDLVKCDVEGAELFVFRGASRTLAEHAPIVFTELLRKWCAPFGYHPNELITLLASHGYRCFHPRADGVLAETTAMTDATTETNFFFLHRERHADIISEAKQH
jgi:FkbM family methyltransferase